jgi:hypothetical protein
MTSRQRAYSVAFFIHKKEVLPQIRGRDGEYLVNDFIRNLSPAVFFLNSLFPTDVTVAVISVEIFDVEGLKFPRVGLSWRITSRMEGLFCNYFHIGGHCTIKKNCEKIGCISTYKGSYIGLNVIFNNTLLAQSRQG